MESLTYQLKRTKTTKDPILEESSEIVYTKEKENLENEPSRPPRPVGLSLFPPEGERTSGKKRKLVQPELTDRKLLFDVEFPAAATQIRKEKGERTPLKVIMQEEQLDETRRVAQPNDSDEFEDLDSLLELEAKRTGFDPSLFAKTTSSQEQASTPTNINTNNTNQEPSKLCDFTEDDFMEIETILQIDRLSSKFFYFVDVVEEDSKIFLLGKLWHGSHWASCCLNIIDLQREVYVVPNSCLIEGVHAGNKSVSPDLETELSSITQEIQQILGAKYKGKLDIEPVLRDYCFDLPIKPGMRTYLKVSSPTNLPPLSALNGKTFGYVIPVFRNLIETFLLTKDLKGTQWLTFQSQELVPKMQAFSRCNLEYLVPSGTIRPLDQQHPSELPPGLHELPLSPPINLLSLTIQTNDKLMVTSIATACQTTQVQATSFDPATISTCTFKLADEKPAGWQEENPSISFCRNERALLVEFVKFVNAADPDFIVCHDAVHGGLAHLVERLRLHAPSQIHEISPSRFRMKRSFNGSQGFQLRQAFLGRLVFDLFTMPYRYLKEADCGLKSLLLNHLLPEDLPENSDSTWIEDPRNLLLLIARLQLFDLVYHIAQATRAPWVQCLSTFQSEDVEFYLLDYFKKGGSIAPCHRVKNDLEHERMSNQERASKKHREAEGGHVETALFGIFTCLVLLLDFNSLYPSLILEYLLCWRNKPLPTEKEDSDPLCDLAESTLPEFSNDHGTQGEPILPKAISNLIHGRRQIQTLLKAEKDQAKRKILKLQEQAFKLTANKIYGLLSLKYFLFYDKELSRLITQYGRQLWDDTRKKIEKVFELKVCYGDTDSFFLVLNTTNLFEALALSRDILWRVNVQFRHCQLALDGLFQTFVLTQNKKKRYFGSKLSNLREILVNPNTTPVWEGEFKGYDVNRKDSCNLVKIANRFFFEHLLEWIQAGGDDAENPDSDLKWRLLQETQELGKRLELLDPEDFIIRQEVSKPTNEYDKAIPFHVQVARRMSSKPKALIRHLIPYIIVKDQSPHPYPSHAQAPPIKAVHPTEFLLTPNKYTIDVEWYIIKQIIPSLQKILHAVPTLKLDITELIEVMGADPRAFRQEINTIKVQSNLNQLSLDYFKSFFEVVPPSHDIDLKVFCPTCSQESFVTIPPFPTHCDFKFCPREQCEGILPTKSFLRAIDDCVQKANDSPLALQEQTIRINNLQKTFAFLVAETTTLADPIPTQMNDPHAELESAFHEALAFKLIKEKESCPLQTNFNSLTLSEPKNLKFVAEEITCLHEIKVPPIVFRCLKDYSRPT